MYFIFVFYGCALFSEKFDPIEEEKIEPIIIKVDETKKKYKYQKKIKEDKNKAVNYVLKGDAHLFEGNIHQAYRYYTKALTDDPDNIPASIGLAKCYLKENKSEIAYSSLCRMEKLTISSQYAPEFCFLMIKANISQTNNIDNIGLKKIEDAYYCALPTYRKNPELYYNMGVLYKKFLQYNRAKTFFSKAASFNNKYADISFNQINQVIKLEKCKNCEYHQKLPLKNQITRADTAYILYHELHLTSLLRNLTKYNMVKNVKDIDNHPFKNEIKAILIANLSGLSLFNGKNYQPEMPLIRGEFAQILYEIVNRVSPQIIEALKHKKMKTLISDIRKGHIFYNSVNFCTKHLIMKPQETGEFEPYASVSGAEAMMSIRTIKKFFNKYDLTRN